MNWNNMQSNSMIRFLLACSILLAPFFSHSKEECSEVFYECFDANDRFVSAQSYPCEKGLRQIKQRSQWNDPRKMEHGAVVLKCDPCGPCYGHSWEPIHSQQQLSISPSTQTSNPSNESKRASAPQSTVASGYDITAYCQKVSQAIGGSYQIEQTCREEERKAQSNIARMSVPSQVSSYCQQVGQAVGGSYQILETCISEELKAKTRLN